MKRFFFRGLAALLPIVLTFWVFYFVFEFLYSYIGVPIGQGVHYVLENTTPPKEELPWKFAVLGFCTAFLATLVLGFFVATFFGRKLQQLLEWMLRKMPIIRVIYPYAKQFTDFLFSTEEQKKMEFKSPVAVPFPTQGMYSVGFVTSQGLKHLNEVTGK
ncbi:MAG: DUF502 domain-containing protein, partial [Planctomycetota bacterium]